MRLRGGESSLWTWWKGLLSKLGLFSKTGKLLVLGLDNAGKSTLLTLLIRDEVRPERRRLSHSAHGLLDRLNHARLPSLPRRRSCHMHPPISR